MPRLERWSLFTESDVYTAPECLVYQVQGFVYGNPKFEDGKFVHTSRIVELNIEEGYAQTLNIRYELGEVNPNYTAWLEENGKSLQSIKKG